MTDGPRNVRIRRLRIQVPRELAGQPHLLGRLLARELGQRLADPAVVQDADAVPARLRAALAPVGAESPARFARRAARELLPTASGRLGRPDRSGR